MSVAGLVLAAGRSTRFRTPGVAAGASPSKLLLPYGPRTVLDAVVRAAVAADLSPVVVVVGHRADEVGRVLEGPRQPVVWVENPDHETGQASSLAAGVEVARRRSEVEAVAVLLADEPGIRPEWIRTVVARWREAQAGIARAAYSDRPGHPVVFGRSKFDDLLVLAGDQGAASLLRDARHAVCNVRIDSPAPVDVDTERDYREALRRRAEEIAPS